MDSKKNDEQLTAEELMVVKRVKACREVENISLMEMERMTGISHSVLQRYESGKTKKISLEMISKIAKALHVDPYYLLGYNSEENKEALDENYIECQKDIGEAIELMKQLPDDMRKAYVANLRTLSEISRNRESK